MPNFLARSWARVVCFMNPSASELNFKVVRGGQRDGLESLLQKGEG